MHLLDIRIDLPLAVDRDSTGRRPVLRHSFHLAGSTTRALNCSRVEQSPSVRSGCPDILLSCPSSRAVGIVTRLVGLDHRSLLSAKTRSPVQPSQPTFEL